MSDNRMSVEEVMRIKSYEERMYAAFCQHIQGWKDRFGEKGFHLVTPMFWRDYKTHTDFQERPDFFDGYICMVDLRIEANGRLVECAWHEKSLRDSFVLADHWTFGDFFSYTPFFHFMFRRRPKKASYRFMTDIQWSYLLDEVDERLQEYMTALTEGIILEGIVL